MNDQSTTPSGAETMNDCVHTYSYAGTVYSYEEHPRPGSGAHTRIYEDRFFCCKCLATRDINPRVEGNSYTKPIEGTIPK